MNIIQEGTITIGPRGDIIVTGFVADGTEAELRLEVLRRLRLAAEATGIVHNPASCACVSCAMLRLSLKAQIKAEMEATRD